jgi:hypothetical protein
VYCFCVFLLCIASATAAFLVTEDVAMCDSWRGS